MSNTEATAVVVADSISPDGVRITTFQLRYWRPIHSELMTHRVFSRNAGSSRARPSAKIIEQVLTDPWGPIHWGLNEPGMQANEEMDMMAKDAAKMVWKRAAEAAAMNASSLVNIKAHKQIINRLLEPFTYIDVLVTTTSFANWDALRDHKDAQPEIQDLARKMKAARDSSTPTFVGYGGWHLPYITPEDWKEAERFCQVGRITRDMPSWEEKLEIVRKISVARCARVSYKAFDRTVAPIEKDLELFHKILGTNPLHASPAEHQAKPDMKQWVQTIAVASPEDYADGDDDEEVLDTSEKWCNPKLHGNFTGWIQYRKMLPGEFVPD